MLDNMADPHLDAGARQTALLALEQRCPELAQELRETISARPDDPLRGERSRAAAPSRERN